jgi:murein DD-endopeptidase MepM/ murein hydrolase activator NlpD
LRIITGFYSKNLIIWAFVLSFPVLANAGVLSFVQNLLSPLGQTASVKSSQSVALLEAPVNIDPSPNTGGGDITVVGGSALLADNDPGGLSSNQPITPSSDQISLYIVRPGDTLSSIAKLFGVSVNTIRWGNDIKGNTVSPGQTLTILPVSGVRHIVKSGDTIKSIAKLYNGNVGEIEQYNNITDSTVLNPGDVVIVPDGEMNTSGSSQTYSSSGHLWSDPLYGPPLMSTGPAASPDGYYIRPTTGPKTQGIHGYNAVDIAPPYGTPIVAAAAGKVIVRKMGGWNGGYGNYIVIQHGNGTQTLYAHMSREAVPDGVDVVQGQVIGYVGATGKVTGPHLHFEIRGAPNPF